MSTKTINRCQYEDCILTEGHAEAHVLPSEEINSPEDDMAQMRRDVDRAESKWPGAFDYADLRRCADFYEQNHSDMDTPTSRSSQLRMIDCIEKMMLFEEDLSIMETGEAIPPWLMDDETKESLARRRKRRGN